MQKKELKKIRAVHEYYSYVSRIFIFVTILQAETFFNENLPQGSKLSKKYDEDDANQSNILF